MTAKKFRARIKRKEYFHDYGRERERPHFFNRVFAFLIMICPKIGPLSAFKFRAPGPEGEKLFIKSFDTVLVCYSDALSTIKRKGRIELNDIDYDTGKPTRFGEYGLADQAYSELVITLDKVKFNSITPHLKQHILSFYSRADSTVDPPRKLYEWKPTNLALQKLKDAKTVPYDSLKFPVDTSNNARAAIHSSR